MFCLLDFSIKNSLDELTIIHIDVLVSDLDNSCVMEQRVFFNYRANNTERLRLTFDLLTESRG